MDKTTPASPADSACAPADSGLAALALVARLHGLATDPDTLRHRHGRGDRPLDAAALLRAARDTGLRARLRAVAEPGLDGQPLPALAETHGGEWLLLARVSAERVLVQEPGAAQPRIMPRAEFLAAWSGRLLLLARRGAGEAATRFGLGWFLRAARPYRRILAEVLLGSAVLQVLGLVTPVFFQVVVDKVLVHKVLGTLQVLVAGFVAVSLFEVLLGGLRAWLLAHTTNRIDVTLGARLFAHVLALPLRYFEVRRVGEIAARVRELETLRAFVTGSALTLLIDLGFTVIAFALMYHYSPLLCAVVALSLPLYLLLSLAGAPLLRAQVEEKFRLGAENQSFLVESLAGMHTLKAMALEPPMQRRWEEQLAAYVSAAYRATLTANWSAQAASLVSRLVSAGLLWFGAGAVIAGTLSVGELIAFNMLAMRSGAPVLRLFQLWQDFQQARVSLARLGDILNSPGETRAQASRAALPALAGAIRFERVSFRYEPERAHALCELDLAIAPGEVVGIVGRSGSGKSTLARLVQRLYVPEQGRILIDGCDIALAAPDALRRQIGVVPQHVLLFNGSVADNIAYGQPDATPGAVMAAARAAQAHAFVDRLPRGYDTVIGDQGIRLSGGQRQRIALARALLKNPPILVLDEATAMFDPEGERSFIADCHDTLAQRTVILITHRPASLALADRVLRLEAGVLVG